MRGAGSGVALALEDAELQNQRPIKHVKAFRPRHLHARSFQPPDMTSCGTAATLPAELSWCWFPCFPSGIPVLQGTSLGEGSARASPGTDRGCFLQDGRTGGGARRGQCLPRVGHHLMALREEETLCTQPLPAVRKNEAADFTGPHLHLKKQHIAVNKRGGGVE